MMTIPAYVFNEPHTLHRAGLQQGRDFSLIRHHEELLKLGIPMCGDVLFTSQRLIDRQPELVRRFCRASLHGWGLVRNEAGRDIRIPLAWTYDYMKQTFRPFDGEHQKYMLAEVCHYLADRTKPEKETTASAEKDRWRSMIAALEQAGAIKRGIIAPEDFVWAELRQ